MSAPRPYRIGFYREYAAGPRMRRLDDLSRSTFATLDAATKAAAERLAGRKTWGVGLDGRHYVAAAVFTANGRVSEVLS